MSQEYRPRVRRRFRGHPRAVRGWRKCLHSRCSLRSREWSGVSGGYCSRTPVGSAQIGVRSQRLQMRLRLRQRWRFDGLATCVRLARTEEIPCCDRTTQSRRPSTRHTPRARATSRVAPWGSPVPGADVGRLERETNVVPGRSPGPTGKIPASRRTPNPTSAFAGQGDTGWFEYFLVEKRFERGAVFSLQNCSNQPRACVAVAIQSAGWKKTPRISQSR